MNRLLFVYLMLAIGLTQSATSQPLEVASLIWTPNTWPLATDWAAIPSGTYTHGQGDTLKLITYDYAVMKYEVTNAEYLQYLQEALVAGEITISGKSVQGQYSGDTCWRAGTYAFYELGTNTSSYKYGQIDYSGGSFVLTPNSSYANHPAAFVSWFGAWAFAKHYNLRLPTEEEWEKAARGNTGNDYPWGNSLAHGDANYWQSGDTFSEGTTPVGYYNGSLYGSFQTTNRPSPYGAYDMAGNVWEWTDSWGGGQFGNRGLLGGSWCYASPYTPGSLESWAIGGRAPKTMFFTGGFRCAKDYEMIRLERGTFQMGSTSGNPDEIPVHTVTVSGFYLDAKEVTVAQYRAFCTATGRTMASAPSWGWLDDNPIVDVSWGDAAAYAQWAGKRLPNEAEWEYAARGGTLSHGYSYSGSNTIGDVAWYYLNSGSRTHAVGTKAPNELGLYDMSGNAWEWCSDWYDAGYYSVSPSVNPKGPSTGTHRVLRGGSYDFYMDNCRVADRYWDSPPYTDYLSGFRCAKDYAEVPLELGNLVVTLFDAENWGQPGVSGHVVLYNSNGGQVTQGQSNSSSVVTFANILAGSGYYYRVLYNRTTAWGEQFWGEKTGITITANQTTYDTFTHNTPYMPNVSVYIENTNELLPDSAMRIVQSGTRLRIELQIKNPTYDGAQTVSAYGGLYLDRDKAAPYDVSLTTSPQSYSTGSTKTVVFYCDAPSMTGSYYLSVGAFASSGRYPTTLTDASGWHDPAFTVQSGLVAYYPFSGNANDASGNGYNGTTVGTILGADRFGIQNSSYSFNNTISYVQVNNFPILNREHSYSAWIKVLGSGNFGCLGTIDSSEGTWNMSYDNSTNVLWAFDPTNRQWGNAVALGTDWNHVVVTYSSTTRSMYVNGMLLKSQGITTPIASSSTGVLRIGRHTNTVYLQQFKGQIDDVRIYSRALRTGEIDTLYHEGGWPLFPAPPWRFTNTGLSHTIIIPTAANPNINGSVLVAGDYVGVFYDSSGTLACAGYERWTGTANIAVSAFGDDPTSGAKDGFTAGEVFKWRMYRASQRSVYDAQATYSAIGGVVTHTNVYATNGISQLSSLIGGLSTHNMALRGGWSLISSYVVPQSTVLDNIFASVLGDLIILKNGAQKTYIPSVPVNTIGPWVKTEGYQIKMANARTMGFTGQKIIPTTLTIGLPLGWSIMPYVRDSEMSIVSALSGVVGDVVMVKDQDGKTYIPSVGVNGIGTLKAGQAYLIKMATARTIEYPAENATPSTVETANSASDNHSTTVAPPWFYSNTGASHTIIIPASVIPAIDGTPLVAGDCIGVFYDSSGTMACAGYEAWSGTSALAIAAFGDDPTTPFKDGLASGETLRWKIWRQSEAHAFVAIASYMSPGGLGGIVSDTSKYTTNGISAVATLTGSITSVNVTDIPIQYTLMQNYPNPFNPTTMIRFGLPTSSVVTLVVYNVLGEEVRTLINENLAAGYHVVAFDATGFPSGIYFYRMRAGDFLETKKLLLLR